MQLQMTSIKLRVSALANQLSTESMRCVCTENKSEEAWRRLRKSGGMLDALRLCGKLRRLREENEELCERLVFMEGEAEDRRDRNNVEWERHGEEVEGLRGNVSALTLKWMMTDEELESLRAADACHNIAAVKEKGRGCGFNAMPTTPLADERECIKAQEDESELTNGRPLRGRVAYLGTITVWRYGCRTSNVLWRCGRFGDNVQSTVTRKNP